MWVERKDWRREEQEQGKSETSEIDCARRDISSYEAHGSFVSVVALSRCLFEGCMSAEWGVDEHASTERERRIRPFVREATRTAANQHPMIEPPCLQSSQFMRRPFMSMCVCEWRWRIVEVQRRNGRACSWPSMTGRREERRLRSPSTSVAAAVVERVAGSNGGTLPLLVCPSPVPCCVSAFHYLTDPCDRNSLRTDCSRWLIETGGGKAHWTSSANRGRNGRP